MEALALIIYMLSLLAGGFALSLAFFRCEMFDTWGVRAAWGAGLGITLTAFLYNT
jgi:hypothetical protein